MPEDFSRKQNHRGCTAQIFFSLVVETPLKKLRLYTPVYVPFTAKRGQLRQSSKVKSCIRIARRRVEMTEVMVEAVEIFLIGF